MEEARSFSFKKELNKNRKRFKDIKEEIAQYRRFLSEPEVSWLYKKSNIEDVCFSDMFKNIYYDTNSQIGEKLIKELKNRKREYELEQKRRIEEELQKKQKKQRGAASASGFKSAGVIYSNGRRYTYYSSRVLRHYRTNEWTVGSDGIYRDSDGYIVVAASDMPQGSVTSTPFGDGKVYDSGCAAGTIDVYTNY